MHCLVIKVCGKDLNNHLRFSFQHEPTIKCPHVTPSAISRKKNLLINFKMTMKPKFFS